MRCREDSWGGNWVSVAGAECRARLTETVLVKCETGRHHTPERGHDLLLATHKHCLLPQASPSEWPHISSGRCRNSSVFQTLPVGCWVTFLGHGFVWPWEPSGKGLKGGNAERSLFLRVRSGHSLQLVVTLHSWDRKARRQGTGELGESLPRPTQLRFSWSKKRKAE